MMIMVANMNMSAKITPGTISRIMPSKTTIDTRRLAPRKDQNFCGCQSCDNLDGLRIVVGREIEGGRAHADQRARGPAENGPG